MKVEERKRQILAAIVETYTRTGEPVGSKTLTQLPDFNVSSATIRNDMAELFEQGLLEQPHTSAGRIPSQLGYRVYIDRLMHPSSLSEQEKNEIDALFNVRDPDPDRLLEDAAKALAEYTNCVTISSTITPESVTVKRIEIIPAGMRTVVIVLIASNGVIKNKVCRVSFVVTPEIVEFFNKFANNTLVGNSLSKISSSFLNSVAVSLGEYSRLFTPLLATVFELCREINSGQFFINGETNLLSYRELRQIAYDILTFLNRKDEVLDWIAEQEDGVHVRIGRENAREQLMESAVVIAKYNIGKNNRGAIGVLGPLRLDYANLIPHLEYFAKTLGKLLSETFEQQE